MWSGTVGLYGIDCLHRRYTIDNESREWEIRWNGDQIRIIWPHREQRLITTSL